MSSGPSFFGDPTAPGLPIKTDRFQTMSHVHKSHGTNTLFAALNVLEGKVIGRRMQRHRHQDFIRFLNTGDAAAAALLPALQAQSQECAPGAIARM